GRCHTLTDHHLEDARVVGVLQVSGFDAATTAQDRGAAAQLADLVEAMGDVQDRRPFGGFLANQIEQPVGRGQYRGGFIQNQQ
nr:hypothetical protein [Tanacetum cinerariifolium]